MTTKDIEAALREIVAEADKKHYATATKKERALWFDVLSAISKGNNPDARWLAELALRTMNLTFPRI